MTASPRLAVRAVVIEDERLLLARYESEGREWYIIPGGGVQHGETLEEAFARETIEECGHALPFGDVLFVREVMADRHPEGLMPAGLHQVELYIGSALPGGVRLAPTQPDRCQTGLIWQPLNELEQIRFFPAALIDNFRTRTWPTIYCGETG
ncbi:NUDIX domain-containing protein [Granulosicoccaceae sp. 1_MG-2023]|nr:NUDIX domain-containing protein [Granulosicoccaceae sp. 1_MG-2023]